MQNHIAVIWDFDQTLIPGNMEEPVFRNYGIEPKDFWEENNSLEQKYRDKGIKTNSDTIYLNHMITCTQSGLFAGLNNKMLHDFGKELNFYDGVPEIFDELKNVVHNNPKYQKYDISVENYIVSTGLAEIIKGSKVADKVDGIWGCEFIEEPIQTKLCKATGEDVKTYTPKDKPINHNDNSVISQIGYTIDNTSKTRAIFEINKGTNKDTDVNVNDQIPNDQRRIPLEYMIYVADGPSDIPVYSIINQYHGKTFAVYPPKEKESFEQVEGLRRAGRINMFGEADYRDGTLTNMWLKYSVCNIADAIYNRYEDEFRESIIKSPKHINSVQQNFSNDGTVNNEQ